MSWKLRVNSRVNSFRFFPILLCQGSFLGPVLGELLLKEWLPTFSLMLFFQVYYPCNLLGRLPDLVLMVSKRIGFRLCVLISSPLQLLL